MADRDKSAAVAVDFYKLPTFKQILDEAGYSYEELGGITPGTATLKVAYAEKELPHLTLIIKRANREAAKKRMN